MNQIENFIKVHQRMFNREALARFGLKHTIVEEKGRFVIIQYTEYKDIPYEDYVIKLIRQRYTVDQELAILRQRDSKPKEFKEYNDYVEECKDTAKEFVRLREANKL